MSSLTHKMLLRSGILLLVLAAVAACGNGDYTGQRPNTTYGLAATVQQSGPGGTQFLLGSGDKIRINVFGADQVSGEYEIDLSGSVSMPLLGSVHVAGKLPSDVATMVAKRLTDENLVKNPQVNVEVVSARPFYILGEVEKPGEYPYRAGMNVVSAVATAGGFRYRADQDYVYIRRAGDSAEVKIPTASAAPVYPGDIVRVPGHFF